MAKKSKPDIVAGIDIGSHALRMKIAEISDLGKIKTLEVLRYPISLGADTFTTGKINFAAVEKTCEILKGFKKLMSDYQVSRYRIVATSAVREAENRDYILDQIKVKTGLNIDLINTSQEKFLIYKSIRENLTNYQKFRVEGAMLLDLGSGSISVSIYHDNKLTFTQNIKLGSLRLHEILLSIENKNINFPKTLEEYIASNIDRLQEFIPDKPVNNFIVLGGNAKIISTLCNKTEDVAALKYIDIKVFNHLYDEILNKTIPTIVKDYHLPYERANILIPSMMVLKKFLEFTSAGGIYAPLVSLRDGIVCDIADKIYDTQRSKDFVEDVVSSARFIAQKYKYDQNHSEDVEKKSLLMFDKLVKLHGLGFRERFLLKLATILHDTGKFLSFDRHADHSYSIIMASGLMGISDDELKIIANVAGYHSSAVPRTSHQNFQKLKGNDKIIVAKLVAIIRMADALDRSHRQKIFNLRLELKETELIVKGEAQDNILLEEWTFETKSEFFQEVFGVRPILKIKRMTEYGKI
ncbi:MAG: HD domain-containing protein [Peptococcaceae bacterium]